VLLASNGKPVLWHCTAGKDRAGFAAALILRLLGMPMQTILTDYLLSARYSKMPLKMLLLLFLKGGIRAAKLIQVLYEVRVEWMQTAFDTIDAQWGSFENYTHAALGLTDADLLRLREMYTEEVI
jgi:protein-tyrosine phosphatase